MYLLGIVYQTDISRGKDKKTLHSIQNKIKKTSLKKN